LSALQLCRNISKGADDCLWPAIQVARQSVTGRVLEPCNISVTMASNAGSGDVTLEVTKLKLNVSVDVLELVLSLQSSVLDPLVQPSPDKCAAPARAVQFGADAGCCRGKQELSLGRFYYRVHAGW